MMMTHKARCLSTFQYLICDKMMKKTHLYIRNNLIPFPYGFLNSFPEHSVPAQTSAVPIPEPLLQLCSLLSMLHFAQGKIYMQASVQSRTVGTVFRCPPCQQQHTEQQVCQSWLVLRGLISQHIYSTGYHKTSVTLTTSHLFTNLEAQNGIKIPMQRATLWEMAAIAF